MKKNKQYFSQLFLLLMACISFTACTTDSINDNEDTGGNNGNNNLDTGQIQIKVYPNKNNMVRFVSTAQTVTIDWGDGNIDKLTPNGVHTYFKHEYTNKNLQTILVTTTGLTLFSGGNVYYDNIITFFNELRFGDCSQLETVIIGEEQNMLTILEFGNCLNLKQIKVPYGKLTSLSLQGLPSVNNINCYRHNLSESALNQIFKDLPKTNGEIACSNNPGWETCDRTIVEKKGWTVLF